MRETRTAAEIIHEVNTLDKLIPFLEGYFQREPAPGRLYHEKIAEELQKYPHRAQNAAYIRLFVQLALMAAVFGFPRNAGHIGRHSTDNNSDVGDFTHPIRILETKRYMGVIGTKAINIKQELVKQSPGNELSIWSRYGKPAAEGFDESLPMSHRLGLALPILIPDQSFINFHENISKLPLTREDAQYMVKTQFVNELLPIVGQIYSHIPGIESVFLNEQTWGAIHTRSRGFTGF